MSYSRRSLLAGICGISSGLLSGCAALRGDRVTESFDRREQIPAGAEVRIETPNGEISVRPNDVDMLRVTGEKSVRGETSDLDRVSVDIETGPQTTVKADIEEPGYFGGGGSCDFEVLVPPGATVTQVETLNGAIDVQNVTGDVTARSENGRVSMQDVEGYVAATVSNGRTTIRNTTGLREVIAENGAIDVDVHDIKQAVLVSTENGDVTVGAGSELACRVVLSTNTGDVDIQDVAIDLDEQSEERVVGRLNGATSPELDVSTTTGDVLLRSPRGSPPSS